MLDLGLTIANHHYSAPIANLPLIPGAGTTMGFIPGIKVIILVPTGATSRAFI